MSRENYINVKSKLHSFSRSPLAEGQMHYDQLMARSGHTVFSKEIRSSVLPVIESLSIRNEKFLIKNDYGKLIVGGERGKDYVNVLNFVELGTLKSIPGTNNESFFIIDDNENIIKNWIDPSDVSYETDNRPLFSEGYEIRLFTSDGKIEIPRDYGWDFDPFNGIIHFSSIFKPNESNWIEKFGNELPKIQGFTYIGKYVSDVENDLKTTVNNAKHDFDVAIGNSLRIQPIKFSSTNMIPIDDPYQVKYSGSCECTNEWFIKTSFIVNGYCFELNILDTNETILTEMKHLLNGSTQIILDLPYDPNTRQYVIGYSTESGYKTPITGEYKFVAISFIQSNGLPIKCNEMIDYTKCPQPPIFELPNKNEDFLFNDEDRIDGVTEVNPLGTYVGGYGSYPDFYCQTQPGCVTVNLNNA